MKGTPKAIHEAAENLTVALGGLCAYCSAEQPVHEQLRDFANVLANPVLRASWETVYVGDTEPSINGWERRIYEDIVRLGHVANVFLDLLED